MGLEMRYLVVPVMGGGGEAVEEEDGGEVGAGWGVGDVGVG